MKTNDAGEKEFDILNTFLFEMTVIIPLCIAYFLSARLMKKTNSNQFSFLGSKFFVNLEWLFKYLLVGFMLYEIFLVPNLLELPALFLFVCHVIVTFMPEPPSYGEVQCSCFRRFAK